MIPQIHKIKIDGTGKTPEQIAATIAENITGIIRKTKESKNDVESLADQIAAIDEFAESLRPPTESLRKVIVKACQLADAEGVDTGLGHVLLAYHQAGLKWGRDILVKHGLTEQIIRDHYGIREIHTNYPTHAELVQFRALRNLWEKYSGDGRYHSWLKEQHAKEAMAEAGKQASSSLAEFMAKSCPPPAEAGDGEDTAGPAAQKATTPAPQEVKDECQCGNCVQRRRILSRGI